MRAMIFAGRCAKEILRDPMNFCFGLGFPLVLLFLLSAIQANVPVALFEIYSLAPGLSVFGLAFLALFAATLVAKDRESAFLQRLYTTPLTGLDYLLGYMLPFLPIALGQSVLCYLFAVPLGLSLHANVLLAVLGNLPIAVFYIGIGVFCGSVLSVKQVGGICGALLTNLSAWLSGGWFDLSLVGGVFQKVAQLLPFWHAVEWEKALLKGAFSQGAAHLLPIGVYAVGMAVLAGLSFLGKRKNL